MTPPRILIVDDNETNRRVAELQVGQLGFAVGWAADGATALERLATEPFDLVLLDAMMPGLDGPAVAREIRRREAAAGGPPIPIVAVTGSILAEDVSGMLDAGMDDHLAKPLQVAELVQVLARRLPSGGARRANLIPRLASPPEAAVTGDGQPFLDAEAIDGLADLGDAQIVERVVHLFLADAAERVAEVGEAVALHDAPRLHAALDGLERICDHLGATALGRRAGHVHDELRRREARGEDPFAVGLGASDLEPLLDATRARLQ